MAETTKRKSRGDSGFGTWLAGGVPDGTASGDKVAAPVKNCLTGGKSLLRSVVTPHKKLKDTTEHQQGAALPSPTGAGPVRECAGVRDCAGSTSSKVDRIGRALQQYVVSSSALGNSKQRIYSYDKLEQPSESEPAPPIEASPALLKAHPCLQGLCR